MKTTHEWHVTRMLETHIPSVAAIEALCFAEPWSEGALTLLVGANAVGFVALDRETVVGYGGMLISPDEGQITNIAVHPDARRRGVGRAILVALISECERRGLSEISLEVRISNTAAKGLYEAFGFAVAGIRKRFYRHPPEDGLVMIRNDHSKTEEQETEG